MQYVIIQDRVLSTEEYSFLMTHGEGIADRVPNENELSLRLVYGALKPQVGEIPLEAIKDTQETLGCWYGAIIENQCVLSTLVDIELREPLYHGYAVDIPFAALLRTSLEVNHCRGRSTPVFVRYEGMTPAENLLNRPAVLCLHRCEGRLKEPLTESGWRDSMSPERAARSARLCR